MQRIAAARAHFRGGGADKLRAQNSGASQGKPERIGEMKNHPEMPLSDREAKKYMGRKPRADSTLKVLPQAKQSAIYRYAEKHTLDATLEWLAADGIKTSRTALSEFVSWYSYRAERRLELRERLTGAG